MKDCNKGPSTSCESFNETAKLEELKQRCLMKDDCVAVSCDVNLSDKTMCNRYMFSSSCNDTTIQGRNGWSYHIMKPGKYLGIGYLYLHIKILSWI